MGIIPALLRSTSTRPKPSTARLISASTSARFVTSVANPMALPPAAEISFTTASILSERRAPRTTLAPCCARSFAVLSPMPLLAPVMTTTLSVIFDISCSPHLRLWFSRLAVTPSRRIRVTLSMLADEFSQVIFRIAGFEKASPDQLLDALLCGWSCHRSNARVPPGFDFDIRRQTSQVDQAPGVHDGPFVE